MRADPVPPCRRNNRGCAISPHDIADAKIPAPDVPPLQRTAGQLPPIAANAGLSHMPFNRDGDAGPATAIADALAEMEMLPPPAAARGVHAESL